MLGGHGTNDHRVAGALNAFQFSEASQVDEVLRSRQPELHHGYQALPAGEHACLVPVLGEQGRGFGEALGTVVGEWSRNHDQASCPYVASPAKLEPLGHAPEPAMLEIALMQPQGMVHGAHKPAFSRHERRQSLHEVRQQG